MAYLTIVWNDGLYQTLVIQKGFEDNNTHPFWKFVKAQRQDNFGIPPLKHHGALHTDSKTKAQIMLDEFTSVFTCEDTFFIPRLKGHLYPDIDQLQLNQEGVAKLLSYTRYKASDPDNIPCRTLKELALEIAPTITAICRQSLELGTLPCDWKEAMSE